MEFFSFFYTFRDTLRLRRAVIMADNAHLESGERFYVMPTTDGKLIVTDRKNFRILRQKHYISRNATVRDLETECFYCTPYRNGQGTLPPEALSMKRRQFLAWSRAQRKYRRFIRRSKKEKD